MSVRWLAWHGPMGTWHLLGSRVVFGRVERRWQVLVWPVKRSNRRFSFGWGKRPGQ